jgi:hypothetical protein
VDRQVPQEVQILQEPHSLLHLRLLLLRWQHLLLRWALRLLPLLLVLLLLVSRPAACLLPLLLHRLA